MRERLARFSPGRLVASLVILKCLSKPYKDLSRRLEHRLSLWIAYTRRVLPEVIDQFGELLSYVCGVMLRVALRRLCFCVFGQHTNAMAPCWCRLSIQ